MTNKGKLRYWCKLFLFYIVLVLLRYINQLFSRPLMVDLIQIGVAQFTLAIRNYSVDP